MTQQGGWLLPRPSSNGMIRMQVHLPVRSDLLGPLALQISNRNTTPAPYCNGAEMVVDSDVPLGILAGTTYAETHYQIAAGDRRMFISDGVIEATNA